jgi:hypothetical protein
MNGHQIPVILMVETIEYRSPGITVIVFKYVYIEIPAFFVFYLIVIHSEPPITRSLFCGVLFRGVFSNMCIGILAEFLIDKRLPLLIVSKMKDWIGAGIHESGR